MTADWHREGSVDQQAGRAQVQLTLTGPKGSGVLYANLLKWPVEEGGDKVCEPMAPPEGAAVGELITFEGHESNPDKVLKKSKVQFPLV